MTPVGGRVALVRPAHGAPTDAGFLTIQFVWAVGLSLVLFTMLANLIAFQYGRGVARAAADEGARAGSRLVAATVLDPDPAIRACERRGSQVLEGLFAGAMASGVSVQCHLDGPMVVARVTGAMSAWLPLYPDWPLDVVGTSFREVEP